MNLVPYVTLKNVNNPFLPTLNILTLVLSVLGDVYHCYKRVLPCGDVLGSLPDGALRQLRAYKRT